MYQAVFFATAVGAPTSYLIPSTLVKSAKYTLQHGIAPGTISVKLLPQASFGGVYEMDCYFADTDGNVICLPRSKLDNVHLENGPSGQFWVLSILDRRWQWRFGQVSGHYNLYNSDQTPITSATVQLNPRKLATLCLQAMNETGFDVSALPTSGAYPTVDWDYANPMSALEELVEQFGCRVVYKAKVNGTGDFVKVEQAGTGAALDVGADNINVNDGIDTPETPDEIAVVTAPIEFQIDLRLQAVGMDVDGTIVAIDDLSYAPPGGWNTVNVYDYFDTPGLSPQIQLMARDTIFKWYQIDPYYFSAGYVQVPNPQYEEEEYEGEPDPDEDEEVDEEPDPDEEDSTEFLTLEHVDQILPTLTTQLESIEQTMFTDSPVSTVRLAPWVYGIWYNDSKNDSFVNNIPIPGDGAVETIGPSSLNVDNPAKCPDGSFIYDPELGIVKFREMKYLIDVNVPSDGEVWDAARLVLRIGFPLKDQITNQEMRDEYAEATGSTFGTQTQYVIKEELKRQIIAHYDEDNTFDIIGGEDNQTNIATQAQEYLSYLEAAYAATNPLSIEYRGLQPIQVDGAIQEITWSCGDSEASRTYASRNNDAQTGATPYEQQRWERQLSKTVRKEQLRAVDAKFRKDQPKR